MFRRLRAFRRLRILRRRRFRRRRRRSLANRLRLSRRARQEFLNWNWTRTCVCGGFRICDAEKCVACERRRYQKQNASRQPDFAHSVSGRVHPQQMPHPFRERSAIRRHGKHWSAAPFLHERQCARVLNCITAERNCGLVAAVLAFSANAAIQPPHCRMVKKQRLDTNLEHVHERIEPPDVRQFVRNHHTQLFLRESR